jgi:hypothetical protein
MSEDNIGQDYEAPKVDEVEAPNGLVTSPGMVASVT